MGLLWTWLGSKSSDRCPCKRDQGEVGDKGGPCDRCRTDAAVSQGAQWLTASRTGRAAQGRLREGSPSPAPRSQMPASDCKRVNSAVGAPVCGQESERSGRGCLAFSTGPDKRVWTGMACGLGCQCLGAPGSCCPHRPSSGMGHTPHGARMQGGVLSVCDRGTRRPQAQAGSSGEVTTARP